MTITRLNRVQIATCSILLISLLTIFPLLATGKVSRAESLGQWTSTTPFPNSFAQCVTSSGYVYCLSGNDTYYSELTSSGVGSWSPTTPYPIAAQGISCVALGDYIYCVGGYTGGSSPQSSDYYAPLSSSGVGAWTNTTGYPIPVWGGSCAATASNIFCVGGMEAVGTLQTTSAFYAPVSSSGIGTWINGTNYPISISLETCLTSNGFIYCLGGRTADGPVPVDSDYYAAISSSGLGSWSQTTNYPVAVQAQSCVTYSSFVYCVGGYVSSTSDTDSVYYSALSSSGGIGSWLNSTSYPVQTEPDCVSSASYIYCLTGSSYVQPQLAVYYTAVLPGSNSTSTSSSSLESSTNSTRSSTEKTASTTSTSVSSSLTIAPQNSTTTISSSAYTTSTLSSSSSLSTSLSSSSSERSSTSESPSNLSTASQYTLTGSQTLLGPTALAGTIAAVMIAVVGSIVAVFAKRR